MVSEERLRQTGMMADEAQVEALAQDLIADMTAAAEASADEPVAEVNAPKEAEEIEPVAAEKKD